MIVSYTDNMWYRAACVDPGQDKSLLIFVDYGNMESVAHSDICQIPEDFLALPLMVVHCVLEGKLMEQLLS